MAEALRVGLAHPSILDALEHFYRTEVFQQNARLREALVEKQAEARQGDTASGGGGDKPCGGGSCGKAECAA